MIDESAEMQLKQLLKKALDEAFAQGLESGKRTGFESGRRAGIEEAAKVLESKLDAPGVSLQTRLTPWVDQVDCIRSCIAKILALLEAKP